MTLTAVTNRERLDDAVARLADAGVDSPRVDAEWLLAAALDVSRGRLRASLDLQLTEKTLERFEGWVRRRVQREPLQHILGTQAFRALDVRVGPDVLVPRPETELLVSWALEWLPVSGANPVVLDIGTGSGCIACALASERPDLRVVAVDASFDAVAVARANVAALGLAERVTVVVSDLFSTLAPICADLIVSNPPYVPTPAIETLAPEITDHEPRLAIDGGQDGLDMIRRLVIEAPRWLEPGAPLVLEIFGDTQVPEVVALMQEAGFMKIEARRDLTAVTRFVGGRRSSAGVVRAIESWGEAAERRKGGEASLRGSSCR